MKGKFHVLGKQVSNELEIKLHQSDAKVHFSSIGWTQKVNTQTHLDP